MKIPVLVRLAAAALLAVCSFDASPQSAERDYARLCSGCHGQTFRSPAGDRALDHQGIVAVIRAGIPSKGMPAFGARLTQSQLQALAQLVHASSATSGPMLGLTIEGETLNPIDSEGYAIMSPDRQPEKRYVGYVAERSALCYDNVDLTGARSIELSYARGIETPARIAVLIGDGRSRPRTNLGEKATTPTGGWEVFERRRMGLARQVSGPHQLCFYGVEGGGIFNLDHFTLSEQPGEHDGFTLRFEDVPEQIVKAAGYEFVVEKVFDAPSELWSMAFLPDGAIIATQKNGQLLLFRAGVPLERIQGAPSVWNAAQGGLLDVAPHPEYAANGWIYLTFSDPGPNNTTAMTRVVRGKLEGARWVQQQDIYRAPERFYTQNYAHFGSRVAFANGYIYFSIGERQQPQLAQDLGYPFGKVHRLHDDGRIPVDNPFVGHPTALPSIWSYGHRNPQGMTTEPLTGTIWSAEHGPAGGDEVNLIRKGANYGWPLVSFGTHYDGTAVGDSPYLEGIEPPVHHWTPSIAVSQIEFYRGDKFPRWRDQLLVASLGAEELRLVRLRDQRVLNDQLLLKGLGRIRDVSVGPDGYPYVLLQQYSNGIYRLRPR